MKQVTQTLRTGIVDINNVPVPTLSDKFVLVKTTTSIISAGTEKTKIDMGRKNLIQKAQARPDLVKQVLSKIKTEGLIKTFQTVGSRLDAPSPLGYSCAGTVLAVGGLVSGIQPGDRVACGGANYANHAEINTIPENLIVRTPENVSDKEAAFTTVGAIALQGVRLAHPKIGETFLVLGLGLLGQIAVQILRANGCNVIGTDLDSDLVKKSEEFGAIGARSDSNVGEICNSLTGGNGVDGVLICAGTTSNQPIELSGQVTRDKGRVIVVGSVKMDVPREPFFKKEISIVISRSYGPGRYDPRYEEGGQDYPYGYVRFTERRNMETILQLISLGSLNVKSLITHEYEIDDAPSAYKLIEGKKNEPYLGILLNYELGHNSNYSADSKINISKKSITGNGVNISFFGAGNYATASLIPPLEKMSNVQFDGLMTASGRSAQGVASKHNFKFCTGKFTDLLEDESNVIMITTRHDSHGDAVEKAISYNKHVYVEKPLALTMSELSIIHKKYLDSDGVQLMVGFNRRFSPSIKLINEHFSSVKAPLVINIRVNAGFIPSDHWSQDPLIGGGRMIGEGCHFIDLVSAITKSTIKTVFAVGSTKSDKSAILNDNICITLKMNDGSVANITYTADGSKAMEKEYLEVFGGGLSATLHDYKEVNLYFGDGNSKRCKLGAQDKGQKSMLKEWVQGLESGNPCIGYDSIMLTSISSILVVESMSIGMPMMVDMSLLKSSEDLQ